MKYDSQNLRILLAGKYVLGLLKTRVRERFERLAVEDARLRAEVVAWEEKFAAWTLVLKPLAPPASVWRKLQARLRAEARAEHGTWFGRSWNALWSGAALAAAAAVLVVGIMVGRSLVTQAPQQVPAAPAAYLAVMSAPQGQPRWLITVNPKNRRVDMDALADNTPPAGKSYELWMLPKAGKPVSLGLMNSTGKANETLTPELLAALTRAKGLAITVEPKGGSPTGQPTGPVVYTGSIINS
ncbi:MAG: anti-sigma factor [Gammaproteobacteria bacterium]|nr:anti-sigma factor [Gammaproteobacteria bacterium]MDE2346185.1 anti-sigma factor [Gammaproteobacteria bacterium]